EGDPAARERGRPGGVAPGDARAARVRTRRLDRRGARRGTGRRRSHAAPSPPADGGRAPGRKSSLAEARGLEAPNEQAARGRLAVGVAPATEELELASPEQEEGDPFLQRPSVPGQGEVVLPRTPAEHVNGARSLERRPLA